MRLVLFRSLWLFPSAGGHPAPRVPFGLRRDAFMVPHWAVDSQVAAQISYLTPARYARVAPIGTRMGEPLANQPKHSLPKYPYTNTASREEDSQTHAGGSPLRRGLPSTPRPTGAFMTAWAWRATGTSANDVPL